ncbi:hypothetical protein KO561_15090 [Radiobacillus kanasensis]|uniref:hypothetical protein n=1 Tax=Radiobacillus kanasensis TaxID=2844358 RepID=UPI001E597A2F|nr:hypothetical protein [Radiobacillus kanasensis]UFT98510.1 hypothetical protein KO561_15090 [Radiobacillus kanasensis]
MYRIRPIRNLFQPTISLFQLQKAETVTNIAQSYFLTWFLTFLILVTGSYFGIGAESISGLVVSQSSTIFESSKLFFLIGRIVLSFLYPILFVFLGAWFFSLIFRFPYKKAVAIQFSIFILHLVEKGITYVIYVLFDLNQVSNPFSFGVLSQLYIEIPYWNHFFASITLFQIVFIGILYFLLRQIVDKPKLLVFFTVLFFYLVLWSLTALLANLEISEVLKGGLLP